MMIDIRLFILGDVRLRFGSVAMLRRQLQSLETSKLCSERDARSGQIRAAQAKAGFNDVITCETALTMHYRRITERHEKRKVRIAISGPVETSHFAKGVLVFYFKAGPPCRCGLPFKQPF